MALGRRNHDMNHTIDLALEQKTKILLTKKLAGEEGRWEQKTLFMRATVNHYGLYVKSSYIVKHRWFVPRDNKFEKKLFDFKSIEAAVNKYNNI